MKRLELDPHTGARHIKPLRLIPLRLGAEDIFRWMWHPRNAAGNPPVIWRNRVINHVRWIRLYCCISHPAAGHYQSARAEFRELMDKLGREGGRRLRFRPRRHDDAPF